MINNYGPCAAASPSGRQPWIVHGVDAYDEQNFIVNFNATLSEWDDVMANAVIEFGNAPSISTKRSETISKSLSLSLAHDLPQTFFSKTTNSGLDFSIDCPGCATTGSIDIQGKIVLGTTLGIPTSIKSVSIDTSPKGVGAKLALGCGVSGTLGSGWEKEWNLITVGLPGWSIPKIITLGPQFNVDAGFTLSGIQGSAQISAGMDISIPDSSSAVLGITGVDSSFHGWIPHVTPQAPKVSAVIDGKLELYTELSLDIGLTVLSKYGFGGGLFLRLPDVIIDLQARFNTQGVCPGSADVFGVSLEATFGVDLGLGVYTEEKGDKDWKANTTIYQNNYLISPLFKCAPLGSKVPDTAKSVSIRTLGTVPATSKAEHKPVATSEAAPTSAKAAGRHISSEHSAHVSGTGKASGSASATSTKPLGTGVSSIHRYGSVPALSSTHKVLGTGVSSTHKVISTGVSPSASYGTHPDTTASSVEGVSTASTIVIPTKTAAGTIAPAPIATGTISTCDKWVMIEDTNCSCQNIETYYGVSSASLLTWNPALGSECMLKVGEAICIGVKGAYRRSIDGRLARFLDV